MAKDVQQILESLDAEQRSELLTLLLREHFATAESETEIVGDDPDWIVGYLMPTWVRLSHGLGIPPAEFPHEYRGPVGRPGSTARMLERLQTEADAAEATAGTR